MEGDYQYVAFISDAVYDSFGGFKFLMSDGIAIMSEGAESVSHAISCNHGTFTSSSHPSVCYAHGVEGFLC